MANQGHRGSWLGFTYNGIHSSTLGITRISNNRYTDNIIPIVKDTTSTIEGIDGMKYWGSKYTKRVITVPFAFQNMSRVQLSKLISFGQAKIIGDLIFDEAPYKVYSAKITGQALLKYLTFQDDEEEYYNGEGSFTFTCYYPYARSRYVWQEDYTLENIPEWQSDEDFYSSNTKLNTSGNLFYDFDIEQPINGILQGLDSEFSWVQPSNLLEPCNFIEDITDNSSIILFKYATSSYINYNDWIEASKIPSREAYGKYDETNHTLTLYNAGDIQMPIRIWFALDQIICSNISITNENQTLNIYIQSRLIQPSITHAGADQWIVIDMGNKCIEAYDALRRPTGRVYNQYAFGNYFTLPLGESTIGINSPSAPSQIEFNYLYL